MLTKNIIINQLSNDEHNIAKLVQVANEFESEIHIQSEKFNVNCKSIMGVLSLDISNGNAITLTVNGNDEKEALNKLSNFLGDN